MTSYADVDKTLGPVIDLHAAEATAFLELQGRLKAADGDRDAALAAYIASSEDAEVVKFRKAIEVANEKLRVLAEKNVKSETLSEEDRKNLTTELNVRKNNFRDGRKAILSIAETNKAIVNVEAVKQALESIGDPTKSGRGRPVGATGSSLPKASAVLKLATSASDDTWEFQTFGEAAKHLEVPVETLQKAFAAAASVDHADIASVTTPQSFKMGEGTEYPLKNSKATWTITTTPKQRKKPGPRVTKVAA